MRKKTVLFVCIHNSCRSQMAEGWANNLGCEILSAYSAGTEKFPRVKPRAVQVMEEAGIDMSDQYPKLLEDIPYKIDILISMGCGVVCPFVNCEYSENWAIEDPSGGTAEDFRITRNIIKKKVQNLINDINIGKYE